MMSWWKSRWGLRPCLLAATVAGDLEIRPVVRAALDCLGPAMTSIRARLLAQLAITFNMTDEWPDRRAASFEALDIGREAGDVQAMAEVGWLA